MANWKWIIITIIVVASLFGLYNYIRKNGFLDIFAGLFIIASVIFFGGLLFAILNVGKK
jgi:hypothetical protein